MFDFVLLVLVLIVQQAQCYLLIDKQLLAGKTLQAAGGSSVTKQSGEQCLAKDITVGDQDGDCNVDTLAAAIRFAVDGGAQYATRVESTIKALVDGGLSIKDPDGSETRTLAVSRELAAYVLAADFVSLSTRDAALHAEFVDWLKKVIRRDYSGRTVISTHDDRPNNWGLCAHIFSFRPTEKNKTSLCFLQELMLDVRELQLICMLKIQMI
jgi:hypothetical protein